MSLKMPPERCRYSTGGAPGSRLMTDSASSSPISPLLDARLERGEGRIEAALEADQAGFSGGVDDLLALARPAEVEVDRLLAEDMLAGSGGALDEVGVGVGRRADEHGVNATVGKDLFDRDDFRPERGGELLAAGSGIASATPASVTPGLRAAFVA
jgi:hypothetical protein